MTTVNIEALTNAAEQGDFQSILKLANLYYHGNEVKQDLDKAIELYELLCNRKEDENFSISIATKLGLCYAMTQKFEKAFENWTYAANEGDAEALHNLGYCYMDGCGVEENQEKAFEVFKKAADMGFVDSMYEVGICYTHGVGVEQDYEESFYYWSMAAEQGDCNSMFNLAVLYINGYGVEENHETAFQWFLKAAQGGYPQAQYYLGSCYQDGDGVDYDMALAVKWYRTAAARGHKGAQEHLEKMEADGLIVETPKRQTADTESPKDITETLERVCGSDKLNSTGEVEVAAIEAAEEALGVEFADDFVAYTKKYGAISVRDIELCGIVGSENISTVKQTKKMRNQFDDFPIDSYVIESIGIDNVVMVQNTEGRIFQYKPENELVLAGNSLCDYLLNGDDFRKERREYWQARATFVTKQEIRDDL